MKVVVDGTKSNGTVQKRNCSRSSYQDSGKGREGGVSKNSEGETTPQEVWQELSSASGVFYYLLRLAERNKARVT